MHQMLVGYSTYTAENADRVLLGFLPSGANWTVNSELSGITPVSGQSALRYPWRFQPYFRDWRILFNSGPLSNDEINTYSYQLSLLPKFGLNSMFVGGDPRSSSIVLGPNANAVAKPNGGAVVFRSIDVRRPANLIVFAETGNYVGGKLHTYSPSTLPASCPPESLSGYFQLWPPRMLGMRHWHVEDGQMVIDAKSFGMGVPRSAEGGNPVVGFFDGHAEPKRLKELEDMRLWANHADSATYDYVP
jgi:hypothetical protein